MTGYTEARAILDVARENMRMSAGRAVALRWRPMPSPRPPCPLPKKADPQLSAIGRGVRPSRRG